MAKTKEKKSKLFLFIVAILGVMVVGLNLVQMFITSKIAEKKIEDTVIIESKEVSNQASIAIKHLLESYFRALDFYVNSEAAQSGDEAAIIEYMRQSVGTRPEFFNYIGWVNAEGHNRTDTGSESEVSDRVYFKAIMGGADTFVGNPVLARSTGTETIHVCKAVRVNGKTIGFFFGAATPKLVSEALEEMDLGDLGFGVIFGGDGTYVGASADLDAVKSNFEQTERDFPKSYSAIKAMWENQTNEVVDGKIGRGHDVIYISHKVEYTAWTIVLVLYQNTLFAAETAIRTTLVVGMVFLVIALLAVTGAVLYVSIKPLGIVEGTIRGIATGDADLTKRVAVKSNNEIGRIVEGFNLFAEKLQSIISTMKDSKAQLVDAGELLNDSTTDTMAAIHQIIAQIETMGKNVDTQTESVHQTVGAVNQIAGNIESLNRMIESQASSVTQASAAVEEMIGNITSVTNSVEKMAESFEELEK